MALRKCLNQRATDTVIIYALSDPRDLRIRYVGQTCRSVDYRLYEHKRDARRLSKWPVSDWLRKLDAIGMTARVEVLETISVYEDWQSTERKWIAHFRAFGELLNVSDGGDGWRGARHSEETRLRMSKIAKETGRKPPGNKGRVFGAEARANMSAAHIGKPGNKWSEEVRARRALMKRKPFTPEQIENLRRGHLNSSYTATAEHREKLSKAQSRVWQERRNASIGGFK